MTSLHDRSRGLSLPGNGAFVSGKESGFSLLEMMMVIAIIIILTGITAITLQPMLKQDHVNAAYDSVLMTLRNYRSRAITERKRYIVSFAAPGTMTISYWGVNAGGPAPPPVVVQTVALPTDIQFMVQAGTPGTAPDGFGSAQAAIDFGYGTPEGNGLNYVMFMPDGTAQDQLNPAGGPANLNNGIVYFGRPGELSSMRAITVWGASGRVRGWRLYTPTSGANWSEQ